MKWEELGEGMGVWTDSGSRLTTDTLLLAAFSVPKAGENCADLGTGCGAIPVLWKSRGPCGRVLAIELQGSTAALAERSVADSGLSGEIEVIQGDAREYRALLPHQELDLMVCNPPYYPLGRGMSGEGTRRTARCDETFSLADLAGAAYWSLKGGGRLCLCLPVGRMAEAMALFRQERLEPKRLRLVRSGPGKTPYLFLLECRKDGGTGLTVDDDIVLPGGRLY